MNPTKHVPPHLFTQDKQQTQFSNFCREYQTMHKSRNPVTLHIFLAPVTTGSVHYLRHTGHVDNISSQRAIHFTLCQWGKPWSFYCYTRYCRVKLQSQGFCWFWHHLWGWWAIGWLHGNMTYTKRWIWGTIIKRLNTRRRPEKWLQIPT